MIDQAFIDIGQDLDELRYLCKGYRTHLGNFERFVGRFTIYPKSELLEKIAALRCELVDIEKQLDILQATPVVSEKNLEAISEKRYRIYLKIRILIPMIAALVTSTDWQSPTYETTKFSESGVQEGKIHANINDYKRDRHINEEFYQKKFLKEYVDGFTFPAGAYLTNSGMAALTTILTHIFLHKKHIDSVLLGSSVYFENKQLIDGFFRDKPIYTVSDMDIETITHTFRDKQPDIILFDALSNAPDIAVPDLLSILTFVVKTARKETVFIIDNSTLSIALQPLKHIRFYPKPSLR